jgi:hypothetical protein
MVACKLDIFYIQMLLGLVVFHAKSGLIRKKQTFELDFKLKTGLNTRKWLLING